MSEYLEIYRSNGIRNITTSRINQHGGNGPLLHKVPIFGESLKRFLPRAAPSHIVHCLGLLGAKENYSGDASIVIVIVMHLNGAPKAANSKTIV